MGVFDTIETEKDIPNGPEAGEYQTKDLDCVMDNYLIEEGRLCKRLYRFKSVEPSKYTFKLYTSEYLGLLDTSFHGWIELYGAYSTWKLKFTDGDLKECKLMESFEPTKREDELKELPEDGLDRDESDKYWSGDERQYDLDEDDYEG